MQRQERKDQKDQGSIDILSLFSFATFVPALTHSGTVVYFSNVLTLGVGQRSLVEEELKQLSVSMAFEGGQHHSRLACGLASFE